MKSREDIEEQAERAAEVRFDEGDAEALAWLKEQLEYDDIFDIAWHATLRVVHGSVCECRECAHALKESKKRVLEIRQQYIDERIADAIAEAGL